MSLLAEILVVTAKVVFVSLLLSMTVAVLLTWADRRQGAMIQDRVGPNRAVIFMPGKLAALLIMLPAAATAAGALAWAGFNKLEGDTSLFVGFAFTQMAIATIWITLFVIAGRVRVRGITNAFDRFVVVLGEPRWLLFWGLLTHAATTVAFVLFYGTDEGKLISEIGASSGPMVFAVAVLGGALYVSSQLARLPRVGLRLAGLLHPVADGIKMILKEDLVPPSADQFVQALAPFIAFFPVLVVLAVVPFGTDLCFGSASLLSDLFSTAPATCSAITVKLQVLDIDSGALFYFALGGTGVIGAALAGWASNNKYSLLGGMRAVAQGISYEIPLALAALVPVILAGSMSLTDIVNYQIQHGWFAFWPPGPGFFAFLFFLPASLAEANRIPFDIPEAESELIAGVTTEYTGMGFGLLYLAEYLHTLIVSAVASALFFGGWDGPFLPGLHWMVAKTLVLFAGIFAIRWSLVRFRSDQLMGICWRYLVPIGLGLVMVSAIWVQLAKAGAE